MGNSEYAVGTVCIIVGPNEPANYLLGRECTIVKGLHHRTELQGDRYEIEIEGESANWTAAHEFLKPKQPPKDEQSDEAFRSFMDKILFPMPQILEEV